MNISRNTKQVAIVTTAILFFSQIMFAAITHGANTRATALCVKSSGQVIAKNKCQKGESRFMIFPTKVKQRPIQETVLGNARSSIADVSLNSPNPSEASTLTLLSSAPRVFTSLVTLARGTAVGSQRDFSNSMPTCPVEAPLRTSWFAVLAQDLSELGTENDVRISSENGTYRVEIDGIPGTRRSSRFKPSFETSSAAIENTLRVEISSGSSMNDQVRFLTSFGDQTETYDIGGFKPSEPNNNLLESASDSTIMPYNVSFYVSVTCISVVSLTP